MKRIAIKNLTALIAENKDKQDEIKIPIKDGVISIIVNNTISAEEMMAFIDTVVSQSFNGGIYKPMNLQIAYNRSILAYYTNLPYNCNNKIYDYLIYDTDIFSQIKAKINPVQLSDIWNMIIDEVEYKKSCILSEQKISLNNAIDKINREQDEIILEVKNFIQIFTETFQSMDFDVEKLEKILDKAKSLEQNELAKAVVSDD